MTAAPILRSDEGILGRLRGLLACPDCRGPLAWEADRATCGCGSSFPVEDGIPVLLPSGSWRGAEEKRKQAAYFDREVDAEFETERPHGAPHLYAWYYRDKFRRAVSAAADELRGAVAVAVCGGSGMDAEFLADAGCIVLSADVSLGACRRARERARRHDLPVLAVVADAEALPLRDGSVDLAYVHDGLHHLQRPADALREMARVSRRWVSVSEPAAAAVTAIAVRLRLALDREEAGNAVGRVRARELRRVLEAGGFEVAAESRYAMYFRHEPGRLLALLSREPAFGALRLALHAFNAVLGGVGNKLALQARRTVA